jgi:hypothetical protein
VDRRVSKITYEVRKYDRKLFAIRVSNGMIQIVREAEHRGASDIAGDDVSHIQHPQFILALTDDWTLQGNPVEWGLEPIMAKLNKMDSWKQEKILDKMRAAREREEEVKKQSNRNEIRARAADLRREFAKVTDDINTASL